MILFIYKSPIITIEFEIDIFYKKIVFYSTFSYIKN